MECLCPLATFLLIVAGKNVLMYCTGGVRCERASALLKSKYGDNVGEVYQLQVIFCSVLLTLFTQLRKLQIVICLPLPP